MKYFKGLKLFSFLLVSSLLLLSPNEVQSQKKTSLSGKTFGAIEARHIGPARMSGRISAIDAVFDDYRIIYVGSAGGGVWKSINAGVTFEPVFDKYTQSIGAVRIDQNHPDTVWIGSGEPWTRNSVSVGDGIYKTTNAGKSWKKLGLENTERITRIEINPQDPNIVYVAALGHLWNANEERGVYRTKDGGKNWEKVLYIDKNTGCSDLSIDPENPSIIYAGMWDHRRSPHSFRSGGPGSGFYKSEDGGDHWTKMTKGLPSDTIGRIAVDVSPANSNVVYAFVESDSSAIYRSADKGMSWERKSKSSNIAYRPFYFAYIVADPVNENKVYKPGLALSISKDGGETFEGGGRSMGGGFHSDVHALWISKKDTNFIYNGTDGGLYISNDAAKKWRIIRNLPISQFYHVSADDETPYNVYGGLQDNGSWMGPANSPGGIENGDWDNLGGGDGFYVFPDKLDNNIVYWQSQGGNVNRMYKNTQEAKSIKPAKTDDTDKLRFNWDTPVAFGSGGKTMYIGTQYLFKSYNRGDDWELISPDLSTNDPDRQQQSKSGGVTIDNTGAENHCTIKTINESPKSDQIIWVGTDDGNLQVTTDGGTNWTNVVANIPDLPEKTWCSYVYASNFDANTAYVTFDGHRDGDMKAYVYKTTDLGTTWISLADENISSYCHVIMEDFENPNLLFMGTEFGLYISIDGGKVWSHFTGNLPKVGVRDIYIHPRDNDLILATHGRGIVILDDITPLRYFKEEMLDEKVAFLPSRPYVLKNLGFQQTFGGDDEFIGKNPIQACMITYYMNKRHIFGDMFIEIYDKDNKLVNTLPAGKRKGINRVAVNVRQKPPKMPPSDQFNFGAAFGPALLPGVYSVKIIKDGVTTKGSFEILKDPLSPHSDEDILMQNTISMKAYRMIEEVAFLDRKAKKLIEDGKKITEAKPSKSIKKKIEKLSEALLEIHAGLVAEKAKKGEALNKKVREKVVDVYSRVNGYSGRPSNAQIKSMDELELEMKSLNAKFNEIVGEDLVKVNSALVKAELKPLEVISYEAFLKEYK